MNPIQEQPELDLAIRPSPDIIPINGKCTLKKDGAARVVYVAGLPVHHWTDGDQRAEASAMVNLVMSGFADQNDVALSFGKTPRTLRRLQRRFEAEGTDGLGRPRGRPQETQSAPSSWVRSAGVLQRAGLGVRSIAHRLGVGKTAVSKWLARLNQRTLRPAAQQPAAPERPAPASASLRQSDGIGSHAGLDPEHRWLDRLLARLGKIDDAEPIFTPGRRVPRAGVLLAIPALAQSGIFSVAEEVYGHIGPAFYGLRTTMVALLLLALLRIKRPEGLKEHAPPELGRLLGLDRAPEVKTMRRKLTRLAGYGKAEVFGRKLAQRRVARRGKAMGFLYIDGHVRVYHGRRRIPKAHVTRMRLSLPATTDYWVNDRDGDPLFVVTAEVNAGMVAMLPKLLAQVRRLVGKRRVTVIFDRGGWSPKLFARLLKAHFDILTYRKGRWKEIPRSQFARCAKTIEGRRAIYELNDRSIRLMKGRLRLRQITRLGEDGHQTPIVTSRRDLAAVTVAYRMFERWRQENFFKYLREEYALDALVDYRMEPEKEDRTVPNPRRRAVDKQLATARAELKQVQALYGQAAAANAERERPTIRGFKIAHGELGQRMRDVQEWIAAIEARREQTPPRVPVRELGGEPLVRLSQERKHLTNCIKMVAYQSESDLLALLRPRYERADDEGRTLVTTALQSTADLEVRDGELHVTLAALSSPHRSRAVAGICEELNGMKTCFPGTRLVMKFGVAL
ncbi:MAG: helix-turn-helix domain-containing protein [Magnetospirillum sp.]|nr:MAG: helix-turn-helix domain-containing protein [Magnetospirillum sp.]